MQDLADMSINVDDQFNDLTVDFLIEVAGEKWRAHDASVAYRDVLLFCDKGVATFLVDRYDDKNTYELFDWETDNE